MTQTIQSFIHRRMVVLREDTPAQVAARAMYEQDVGCVIVSDHRGHIVGIVTDRDLCCRLLAFGLSDRTPLSDLMSHYLEYATEESGVLDVIQMMQTNGIRRIPILPPPPSKVEQCIGIVTLDDLILSDSITPEQTRQIIRSQIRRRLRHLNPANTEEGKEHLLDQFFCGVANTMEIEQSVAEPIFRYLLTLILQEVPYNTTTQLISKLPALLQEELSHLPVGPSRPTPPVEILRHFEFEFGYAAPWAKSLIQGFWKGLSTILDESERRVVLNDLSVGLRNLLQVPSGGKTQDFHQGVA